MEILSDGRLCYSFIENEEDKVTFSVPITGDLKSDNRPGLLFIEPINITESKNIQLRDGQTFWRKVLSFFGPFEFQRLDADEARATTKKKIQTSRSQKRDLAIDKPMFL